PISAYVRDVVNAALQMNAASVVMTHNHAGRTPQPDGEDMYATFEAQGALILDSGANFCRVNVTSPGEVLIRGKKFNDNTKIFYSGLQSIPAGESENLVSVSEATLISDKNAQEAADRLFALNCLRIEQEISFVLNGEAPGEAVQVEVMPGKYRPALIRRLETDLAGGFVAKAVMTGE
ncbi:MAG: hypothetical protein IJC39_02405, partial [Firmicutes bacterium]|nr:hypothetical protein [Bacillota bacterium]